MTPLDITLSLYQQEAAKPANLKKALMIEMIILEVMVMMMVRTVMRKIKMKMKTKTKTKTITKTMIIWIIILPRPSQKLPILPYQDLHHLKHYDQRSIQPRKHIFGETGDSTVTASS